MWSIVRGWQQQVVDFWCLWQCGYIMKIMLLLNSQVLLSLYLYRLLAWKCRHKHHRYCLFLLWNWNGKNAEWIKRQRHLDRNTHSPKITCHSISYSDVICVKFCYRVLGMFRLLVVVSLTAAKIIKKNRVLYDWMLGGTLDLSCLPLHCDWVFSQALQTCFKRCLLGNECCYMIGRKSITMSINYTQKQSNTLCVILLPSSRNILIADCDLTNCCINHSVFNYFCV